jgi:hypothetical protein
MVKNKVSCPEEEEEKAMMLEMKMEFVGDPAPRSVIPGTLGNHGVAY